MGVRVEGVQEAIEFVEKLTESIVLGTALEAGSRMQERTPVDTGYLINSWLFSLNPMDAGSPGNNDLEVSFEFLRAAFGLGDTIHINNGAEYAGYIEHGTSRMAPRAMVGRTIPEIPEIAEEQIQDAERAHR